MGLIEKRNRESRRDALARIDRYMSEGRLDDLQHCLASAEDLFLEDPGAIQEAQTQAKAWDDQVSAYTLQLEEMLRKEQFQNLGEIEKASSKIPFCHQDSFMDFAAEGAGG